MKKEKPTMTAQQAKDLLISSYEKTFGELPDQYTLIFIDMDIPRVMRGDEFTWSSLKNWRAIKFTPKDSP